MTFVLPRLNPRLAAESFGFYREAGMRLGFYEPGKAPQIFDPTWTGARSAEAIVHHENMHQQLTANTHHGVLTQLLTRLAEQGRGQESLRGCLEEQWSVQEIAATFSELLLVQHIHPESFESEVSHLPTGLLGQPPYRELFDTARRLMPFEPPIPVTDALARSDALLAVAASSLQTGCLMQLATTAFDDRSFTSYLRAESPHVRFERIVTRLGPAGIESLLRETPKGLSPAQSMARRLEQVRRLATDVTIEDPRSLAAQAARAEARLFANATGGNRAMQRERGELTPEFVDSPDKRARLKELVKWEPTVDNELVAWMKKCEKAGDMHLIVNMTDHYAAVCMSANESSSSFPDDLRGQLPPQTLLKLLHPFPRFPRAITFTGDAWVPWYDLFRRLPASSWIHERLGSAVRLCVHRKLSRELLDRLLDFEGIRHGARAFMFGLGNGLYVGCIENPRRRGAYALQKIPSEAALRIFNDFLDESGVEALKDASIVADFALLRAIVRREFSDPAGF